MDRGKSMNILLNNRSGEPIYSQIYTQLKNQIINGTLAEDEALPSIRNLAKDLRISVITTKRAYDDLEAEGFIYTVPSKGCFVAPRNLELIREDHLRKIESNIQEIKQLALSCNIDYEEVLEIIKVIWNEAK